jgi:hypothetical protein
MAERDKSKIKHVVRHDATHRGPHSVFRVAIQTRLWTIHFVARTMTGLTGAECNFNSCGTGSRNESSVAYLYLSSEA